MLTMTKKAEERIMELKKDAPQSIVRIYMEGIGWGGPRIGLALEESAKEGEQIQKIGDVQFVVDLALQGLFSKGELDYRRGIFGGSFTIRGNSSCCC